MPHLVLAGAQVASRRGDVTHNVAVHLHAVAAAAREGASLVVFPELSLTGYEPDLAARLAMPPDDARLDPLGAQARALGVTVVVGAPLPSGRETPFIGAIVLDAGGTRRAYRKMHLGSSETPFFTPGDAPLALDVGGTRVGIAICADTSRPSHPEAYATLGAQVYAAGVMLTDEWYGADAPRLEAYARDVGLLTLMVNHGASTGTHRSVGRSAAWAPGGALLAQAAGDEACLVLATRDGDRWGAHVRGLR